MNEQRILLGINWVHKDNGWAARLRTATEADGVKAIELSPEGTLNFEASEERVCTGYIDSNSEQHLCPEWNSVSGERQCDRCKNRDYYRDYVVGKSGDMRDGDHSVYLAQCGSTVKVGVTRSSRIEQRWVEQGAVYAAEIYSGLSANQALEIESRLSNQGLKERIQKTEKIPCGPENVISASADKYDFDCEFTDVGELTQYETPDSDKLIKTGRVSGEVNAVIGQIIQVGQQCFAVSSGRVVHPPRQTGLENY